MTGDPSSTLKRVRQEIHASQWRVCGRGSLHYSRERVWQGSSHCSGEGVAGDPFTAVERVWQDMVVHIISLRMQREGICLKTRYNLQGHTSSDLLTLVKIHPLLFLPGPNIASSDGN